MKAKAEKDAREAAAEALKCVQSTTFIDALSKGEESRREV